MNSESKLFPLVCLVGGVLLGVVLIVSIDQPQPSNHSEELKASINALATAIADLDSRLDHLGEAHPMDGRQVKETLDRIPIGESTGEDIALHFASLESTMKLLTRSINNKIGDPIVGNGLSPLDVVDSYPINHTALLTMKGRSETEISIGFLGWSYQQVLSEFGSPTEVWRNKEGGVHFSYEALPNNGDVRFIFGSGKVEKVYSDWDD